MHRRRPFDLTKGQIAFIKANWDTMSNGQMAKKFKMNFSTFSSKVHELGLYRMHFEYWTEEQVAFLKKMYHTCGDKELAEIFNKKWAKKKGWTLKHIEKKRKYQGLKRTKKELFEIKQKAVKTGVYVLGLEKTWNTRGRMKNGMVCYWKVNHRLIPWIKIKGRFVQYNRYLWERKYGKIPKNMNVVFKDGDTSNCTIKNLELVTKAEHARRNNRKSSQGLSDNYIAAMLAYNNPSLREDIKAFPDLIALKRSQLILNRTINIKI